MNLFEKYCERFEELVRQISYDNESNMLLKKLQAAVSPQDKYLVITYIAYGANTYLLRDTDDQAIHQICDQIISLKKEFMTVATIDLFPENRIQKKKWLKALSYGPRKPEWFFTDKSYLNIGVLFCELCNNMELMPGRVWDNLCNHDGQEVEAIIPITKKQSELILEAKHKLLDVIKINKEGPKECI